MHDDQEAYRVNDYGLPVWSFPTNSGRVRTGISLSSIVMARPKDKLSLVSIASHFDSICIHWLWSEDMLLTRSSRHIRDKIILTSFDRLDLRTVSEWIEKYCIWRRDIHIGRKPFHRGFNSMSMWHMSKVLVSLEIMSSKRSLLP